jgi:hypothetical protein
MRGRQEVQEEEIQILCQRLNGLKGSLNTRGDVGLFQYLTLCAISFSHLQ